MPKHTGAAGISIFFVLPQLTLPPREAESTGLVVSAFSAQSWSFYVTKHVDGSEPKRLGSSRGGIALRCDSCIKKQHWVPFESIT